MATIEKMNLHGGEKTHKRRELDYYPTPPDVTRALMDFLSDQGLIDNDTSIWEPACGAGAMSEVLKLYSDIVVSSDIRYTGYGAGFIDFLTADYTPALVDAIITNPPFHLSAEFIKRAVPRAPLVAFLLKSQYWHASKRTALFRKFPPAYILALNWRPDFMNKARGGDPVMECLWTVWIQGETDTKYRILQRPSTDGEG